MKTLLATLAATLAATAFAQTPSPRPDPPVDAATRGQVIDAALKALDQSYVFPEVAAKMEKSIRARQAAGEYAALASSHEFAKALTGHLQEISRDKHLRVTYGSPMQRRPGAPPRFTNHGYEKVEKLPGNIGYLELRTFMGSGPEAEAAASKAMSELADTDALIVDLRANGGGSPHMVALVSSYLFDQPTHLNSLYWREGDRTDEFWTTKEVTGKRFGQSKPVYVLTSKRTFSGAEEFSYNLKNLKRATLVGETTGGGAHPGAIRELVGEFAMFVPTGRAVSPITNTNWEGTGVVPDVATSADEALERARALALKTLGKG